MNTPEETILRSILKTHNRGPVRLFRNTCAVGWVGELVSVRDGFTMLRNARRNSFGLAVGSGDLIGWVTKPDGVAQFVSLEVKAPKGRVREEQLAWDEAVRRSGGRSGIVRSVDEAGEVIGV